MSQIIKFCKRCKYFVPYSTKKVEEGFCELLKEHFIDALHSDCKRFEPL